MIKMVVFWESFWDILNKFVCCYVYWYVSVVEGFYNDEDSDGEGRNCGSWDDGGYSGVIIEIGVCWK